MQQKRLWRSKRKVPVTPHQRAACRISQRTRPRIWSCSVNLTPLQPQRLMMFFLNIWSRLMIFIFKHGNFLLLNRNFYDYIISVCVKSHPFVRVSFFYYYHYFFIILPTNFTKHRRVLSCNSSSAVWLHETTRTPVIICHEKEKRKTKRGWYGTKRLMINGGLQHRLEKKNGKETVAAS